jgi:hypothetical protein
LELEKRLNDFPNNGVDGPDDTEIKIAQITFAFDNQLVINWLKERGKYVKTEKWDKVTKVNEKIAKSLQDPYILDKMQRPCSIFATMETEEGYTRACNYTKLVQEEYTHYGKFLGEEIDLQEASEPTDIIWENRSFTPQTRRIKRCIVYFIIVLMLCVSAAIIYTCTIKSNAKKFKYPKVLCDKVAEGYRGDMDLWESDSSNEYIVNYQKE